MKHTLTIIIGFFLIVDLAAQPQINNIYLKALTEHLNSLTKLNEERTTTYFIEKDWISTEKFPTEINGYKIELLERGEIIKKVKGDNSIRLFAVRPVQWKNEQMEIHIIEFEVSGNKKKLNYINQMNGSSFKIIRNEDCQKFELKRIDN